jgi:hypothetical protein
MGIKRHDNNEIADNISDHSKCLPTKLTKQAMIIQTRIYNRISCRSSKDLNF